MVFFQTTKSEQQIHDEHLWLGCTQERGTAVAKPKSFSFELAVLTSSGISQRFLFSEPNNQKIKLEPEKANTEEDANKQLTFVVKYLSSSSLQVHSHICR